MNDKVKTFVREHRDAAHTLLKKKVKREFSLYIPTRMHIGTMYGPLFFSEELVDRINPTFVCHP